MPKPTVTTGAIHAALDKRYESTKFARIHELANCTGSPSSYCDFAAVEVWNSTGFGIIGHEVKASRSDWLKELDSPAKAEVIKQYCKGWYLVCERCIVKDSEIPEDWGWMSVSPKGNLTIKKRAPKLKPKEWPMEFVAALVRYASRSNKTLMGDRLAVKNEVWKAESRVRNEINERMNRELDRQRKRFNELKESIETFESITGIFIRGDRMENNVGRIAEAVALVRSFEKRPFGNQRNIVSEAEGLLSKMEDLVTASKQLMGDIESEVVS